MVSQSNILCIIFLWRDLTNFWPTIWWEIVHWIPPKNIHILHKYCFECEKTKTKNNNWIQHVLNLYFSGNSVNNLLSYCGLTDARMSASEKDLPVMQDFSDVINMSDHAKGKFLWHILWLTATAFLATKSLQWFQMLKSPFQIDAILFWQFCAKKNRRHFHILANLGRFLIYLYFLAYFNIKLVKSFKIWFQEFTKQTVSNFG